MQLENTNWENIDKLIAFALQNNMKLSLVDNEVNDYSLPGKKLSPDELTQLIESGRAGGKVSMQHAHNIIRTQFNAG